MRQKQPGAGGTRGASAGRVGRIWRVAARLGVTHEELDAFAHAAKIMYLPYDETLGINPQDDSFLQKPIWDLAATPRENFPLLLHYHPLQLYRYQVCKQADTVLAHVLFESLADAGVRQRSFRYYEKITTHDSSLSNCIFCIDACRLGLRREARAFWRQREDRPAQYAWQQQGRHPYRQHGRLLHGRGQRFCGPALCADGVRVAPFLPEGWTGLKFSFQFRGSRLRFEMEGGEYRVRLISGGPVSVFTQEDAFCLNHPGDEARGKTR